jgi:hypothetical protein
VGTSRQRRGNLVGTGGAEGQASNMGEGKLSQSRSSLARGHGSRMTRDASPEVRGDSRCG